MRADRGSALVLVLLRRVDDRPRMDSPIIRTQTPCENCHRLTAVAVAPSGSFVYLGCAVCGQIWSMRDRRRETRSDEVRDSKNS